MKASTELELEAALAAYQQAWLDLATVVPPLSVDRMHYGAMGAALAAAELVRAHSRPPA